MRNIVFIHTLFVILAQWCGSSLLTYGGTSVPFGETASNAVDLCNLRTLKWKAIKTWGEKPIAGYGVVCSDIITIQSWAFVLFFF